MKGAKKWPSLVEIIGEAGRHKRELVGDVSEATAKAHIVEQLGKWMDSKVNTGIFDPFDDKAWQAVAWFVVELVFTGLGPLAKALDPVGGREVIASRVSARPPPRVRGEASSRAKLTDAKVLEIRARYADGESMASLGRWAGVCDSNIEHIIHRRSWTHL